MFQDIKPEIMNTQYVHRQIKLTDNVVIVKGQQALFIDDHLPVMADIKKNYPTQSFTPIYLLSIHGRDFFFIDRELPERDNLAYDSLNVVRASRPKWQAFATVTAVHLAVWYTKTRFCGHCGAHMHLGEGERKMVCPNCGNEVFPRISPAIIVGVRNHDKLLLTKYSTGYNHYALIAGFVEIGETLEETVRREVYEETGLEVKNIEYYHSQPWGFSQSVLVGFFADLADNETYENDEYKDDREELAVTKWFRRQDIPNDDNTLSLTWTMIQAFRKGEIK